MSIKSRLQWAIALTFLVLCAEAVGGWLANSLALLSDAAHMFMDVLSLSMSWLALKLAAQPTSPTKTFGYHRTEIFAGLLNGIFLLAMAAMIFWEAVERSLNPHPVDTGIMITVACFGLVTNLVVLMFLKKPVDHHHDLNLKSAWLHVIGDTLASVAVIVGGTVMYYSGLYWLDSAIAAGVALLLVWGAKSLVGEAVHILLEGVPRGVSLKEVKRELNAIPAVKDIHEMHIWCICSNIYALSTHALINDQKINQTESILLDIRTCLAEKFNITHSTIQFEASPCGHSQLSCEIRH
ncbi:MAG: cation diffusion facilitator family transporter [Nitrospinaceae bacterium]